MVPRNTLSALWRSASEMPLVAAALVAIVWVIDTRSRPDPHHTWPTTILVLVLQYLGALICRFQINHEIARLGAQPARAADASQPVGGGQ